MGQLVFQATAGGQVALVGPNPTSNFSLNVPAVNGNLVTTGDTGTVTNTMLASSAYTAPGTIGSGTPNSGAFTTLSASSTVSGTGFSTYLASPPAIGGTSPSTGKFTSITNTGLTATQVIYATTGGLETSSANMTFNGTTLTLANDASISGLTVGKGGGSVANNNAIGTNALAGSNSGAGYNTAVGNSAGFTNTTGVGNLFVGYQAGNKNTTGSGNSFVGGVNSLGAGYSNTTGGQNTAFGADALAGNTTASNNTAVGYQAGYSNTTGAYNTFLGIAAGYTSNTSGNVGNTCIGTYTGYSLTTGIANTFVGWGGAGYGGAGSAITTGSKNAIFGGYNGNQGGLDIRTASNYIVLSDGDGNPRQVINGSGYVSFNSATAPGTAVLLAIGGSSQKWEFGPASGSTSFVVVPPGAATGVYLTNTGTSWSSVSDERFKENLIPITDAVTKVSSLRAVTGNLIADTTKKSRAFLIAQDVQKVLPEAVDETNPNQLGLAYTDVIPLLVAAITELNAKVTALEAKLGA